MRIFCQCNPALVDRLGNISMMSVIRNDKQQESFSNTIQPTYGGDHLIGRSGVPAEGRCVIARGPEGPARRRSEEGARLVLRPHLGGDIINISSGIITINPSLILSLYTICRVAHRTARVCQPRGRSVDGRVVPFYKNSQLSSFSDLSQYLSAFSYFKITAADNLVPDMQKEFEHS